MMWAVNGEGVECLRQANENVAWVVGCNDRMS